MINYEEKLEEFNCKVSELVEKLEEELTIVKNGVEFTPVFNDKLDIGVVGYDVNGKRYDYNKVIEDDDDLKEFIEYTIKRLKNRGDESNIPLFEAKITKEDWQREIYDRI